MVTASDIQCRSRNCPGFDPSIPRHSGILGAADEAVLNIVYKKGNLKTIKLSNLLLSSLYEVSQLDLLQKEALSYMYDLEF